MAGSCLLPLTPAFARLAFITNLRFTDQGRGGPTFGGIDPLPMPGLSVQPIPPSLSRSCLRRGPCSLYVLLLFQFPAAVSRKPRHHVFWALSRSPSVVDWGRQGHQPLSSTGRLHTGTTFIYGKKRSSFDAMKVRRLATFFLALSTSPGVLQPRPGGKVRRE